MQTILCTTGTSIATGIPVESRKTGGEAFRKAIRERLVRLATEADSREFLERASAESNSVSRLEPTAGDLVVLLHSETEEGMICAEELQRLLESHLHTKVECRRIEGLQATDATRFRKLGVQNLFAELDRRCGQGQAAAGGVVLNVTGGFKSAVPYVTLYGLLHQVRVVYIFEQSHHLFTLPQAPVHFDYDRLAPAADAIATLHRETAMPIEEFFCRIPHLAYHDRPLYEPLLEEEGGQVMLSAFGLLFHEALQRDRGNVYLSPAAIKTLEMTTGDAREQLVFMLGRVGNPLVRRAKRHAFHGTDLEVYKPGNTAQRMAYFMRGSDVHVCELYPAHDEGYEKMLASRRVADYEKERFMAWSRPAEASKGPETDEQWATEQARRTARLEDRCAALQRRAEVAEQQALQTAALEDDIAASRLALAAAEAARTEIARSLDEACTRETVLRHEATAAAAEGERLQRLMASATWLDRLRFLITGRLT